MDHEILVALQGSIAHWEDNVKLGSYENALLGVDNCPLCVKFYHPNRGKANYAKVEEFCVGCPVSEKTGKKWCRGTPYIDIAEYEPEDEEFVLAAQAEVDFLKSLLPK